MTVRRVGLALVVMAVLVVGGAVGLAPTTPTTPTTSDVIADSDWLVGTANAQQQLEVMPKAAGGVQLPSRAAQPAPSGTSKGAALLFWFVALICVFGSLFVITRRNLVVATIAMVGTFFAIAMLYMMLFANFMAAMQVLVYAGAIMVLFVFVIMILNREEDDPWAMRGIVGKGIAIVALAYLLARIGQVLWAVKERAPAALQPVGAGHDFGSVRAVGHVLFRDYLFPFEAVSLLLLIAVVGAVAVARPEQPTGER